MNRFYDLPPTFYEPCGKVNWDIGNHPKYKYLPELQDFVFKNIHALPEAVQHRFREKYNVENFSLLLFRDTECFLALEKEIEEYMSNGTLP